MLILCISSTVLLSQKLLSGNLSQPNAHVISINTGGGGVVVDNATGFVAGDTILVIQMQGVGILTGLADYGNIQNFLGQPGMHEFMIVQSVNTITREIVFRNNLLQTYDIAGNVQIIRVPYYNSAVVTGTLTCQAWDSVAKKGGVLALIVGRSVRLNADIDVSNKGFKGGSDAIGDGRCAMVDPLTINPSYPNTFLNAGLKGEGIAIRNDAGVLLAPLNVKGQGPNFTGGGGGNGRFSGGGGGSNHGAGGIGGFEDNVCVAPQAGGLGGIKSELASFPSLVDRIYLGGGGGASTSLTGLSQPAGNGGGIIIIVTDTIIGNSGRLISNGGDGGTATANGGAGGGGAGGSIALALNSFGSSPLQLSVSGGKGGDQVNYGEGGGGGGGLVFVSSVPTASVQISNEGGLQGNSSNPPINQGLPGDPGDTKTTFKAILNGFLFNSIRSSVTGNQEDSICSNMIPPKITGTTPIGGTPGYTFIWEKSYDQAAWITLTNDPDPTNYTPTTIETTTVWFRRTITDQSIPTPLVDISKPVQIIVQPFIKNNIVGTSDTICFAQNPLKFTPQATLLDGNGKYAFKWQVSVDNSHFSLPGNTYTTEDYTPPGGLTVTSWYRRTVTSGRCIDSTGVASSAIVKITVLDTIQNNKILSLPDSICYGSAFTNLTATASPALSGGDNLFRYTWQSNINGAGWVTAPGVSNTAGYNPVELPQRIPSNQYIYRRVVHSGSNDVCASVSNEVLLKDFPVITNNTIAPVPPICSGSVPADIIGTDPPTLTGGNTIYNFTWQNSTKSQSWANIPGATVSDFQLLSPLTDTTWYRRIVKAVCSDTSTSVQVVVHKPILNFDVTLAGGGVTQTICNSQVPLQLQGPPATGGTDLPGDYAYLWKSSPDNTVFTAIPGATSLTFQPPSLAATTYYEREVISGACTVNSNPITVTVLPTITNNSISGNSTVCYSLAPDIISGSTLSGGSGDYNYLWQQSINGGINWVPAFGTNSSSTYQPPSLFVPTTFRRTVTSGLNNCCSDTSNVFNISIDPLPSSPIYAGPDTLIYSVEKIYHMKAIKPVAPETGTWSPLYNETTSIEDTTGYNTIVRNLAIGKNSFLWTVHRGLCTLSDSVDIELLKDFIPQGFSPNGDEINDVFKIEGLNHEDQTIQLNIVNGAGTEVFSTFSAGGNTSTWKDWNGKNSNGADLSEGTYYYMLKITTNQGQVFRRSGFIILKRY
jgi:gliding motility-associated-like protein